MSLCARLVALSLAAICAVPVHAAGDDAFSLAAPDPPQLAPPVKFYGTYYFVKSADDVPEPDGYPLVGKAKKRFGLHLKPKPWCLAAIEGTISVRLADASRRMFNALAPGAERLADCSVLTNVSVPMTSAEHLTYFELPATHSYGAGIQMMKLVPFRSIAADLKELPAGSVVYVPALKDKLFVDADGQKRAHDGYLYVADIGGGIRGKHIDLFTGYAFKNPFPKQLTAKPSLNFDLHIVRAEAIEKYLKAMHK